MAISHMQGKREMFHQVGDQIKVAVVIILILGVIGSVAGAVMLWKVSLVLGLVALIAGLCTSWLGSIIRYGFGKLVAFWEVD